MFRQKYYAKLGRVMCKVALIVACNFVYGHNTDNKASIQVQLETDQMRVKNTTDGRPTAFIDEPDSDRTVEVNEEVAFLGHGEDDGEIIGHIWNFGIVTIPPQLTPGPHTVRFNQEGIFTITYQVLDNDNPDVASTPATRTITVLSPGEKIDGEWVFGNADSSAYILQSFDPVEANIGPIDAQNPDLLLQAGDRYRVRVLDFETHPLQFIAKGAGQEQDVVILSMNNTTLSLDPELEENPETNWVDSGDGIVEFTLTEALINAMDFDGTHTPGYRSGGAPSAMRGNILGENQLFADFNLVGIYGADQGMNTFSASSQNIFPFWVLDLENETITPPGTTVTIDTIQFEAPYEFLEAEPTNATVTNDGQILSWTNIVLGTNADESFIARQVSASQLQSIPVSVSRSILLNEQASEIPVEIKNADEIDITATITLSDVEWTELNVIVAFFGFEEEDVNPLFAGGALESPVPFATLELLSTTSPEGITTNFETDESDSKVFLKWKIEDAVQANQSYEFRGKVRFNFDSINASATVEPMVMVLGKRSGDQGTEDWDERILNLDSPHTGSVSLTGAVLNQTDDTLHVIGIKLFDKTMFFPETFSISGHVNYDGTQSGGILIQAFSDNTFSTFVGETSIASPEDYEITDLEVGTYFLRAFVDVDDNNNFDPDREASGTFSISMSPQAVTLGPDASEVDVTLSDPQFSISGEITYNEKLSGDILIQAFSDESFSMLVGETTIPAPGVYTIDNMATGMVYIRGFMDVDDNGDFEEESEPSGIFTTSTNPDPVQLGPDAMGININLDNPIPLFSVTGVISYGGSQPGKIQVQSFTDTAFSALASKATISGPGPYSVDNLQEGSYYLNSFVDINANSEHDLDSEPLGKFTINNNAAVVVIVDQNIENINITIPDLPDSDLDGLPDDWENANGLDPNNNNGRDSSDGDPDGDQLTNGQELASGGHASRPTIQFSKGWNLVSWPQNSAQGITVEEQLNGIPWIGSVWTWDDLNIMYVPVTTRMLPSIGYWVFSTGTKLLDVEGNIADEEPKELKRNWNLAGGIHGGNLPDSSEIRSVWEWVNDHFVIPTSISSSKGYWINSGDDITIPNWP